MRENFSVLIDATSRVCLGYSDAQGKALTLFWRFTEGFLEEEIKEMRSRKLKEAACALALVEVGWHWAPVSSVVSLKHQEPVVE